MCTRAMQPVRGRCARCCWQAHVAPLLKKHERFYARQRRPSDAEVTVTDVAGSRGIERKRGRGSGTDCERARVGRCPTGGE